MLMQASLFIALAVALAGSSLMGLPLSVPPLPPDPLIERAARATDYYAGKTASKRQ
jgi:hypothetical protein